MCSTPRALIIGCGYLGVRVGSLLSEAGFRVAATTRSSSRTAELRALGLEPEILDLERPEESAVWNGRYDRVVYAVAPGRGGDARVGFRDGPIDCARRLLAASHPLPGCFVLISSTGVYSETEGGWVDEDSPAKPGAERLRWLVESESRLRELASGEGFPTVILRLGGIYGPGRSPLDWLHRPEMLRTMAGGRGDAYMNWVRVEDAARATVLALEKGRPGEVYIVADGEPVRREDFYGLAAERLGLALPQFAREGDLGKRCRIEKARRELGFEPRYRSYREGLADL